MSFHFRADEKLKSKTSIEQIFEKGDRRLFYPVLFFHTHLPPHPYISPPIPGHPVVQAGFSVSKKNFRRAVDRNRIKRLMREAYRLQKHRLYESLAEAPSVHLGIMMIFIGRDIPEYSVIFDAVTQFIDQYVSTVP